MARINKQAAITGAAGLLSKEQLLTSPMNNDTLTASIEGPEGVVPAKLTEGEFVFSIPAIIALGEGNYDVGIEKITMLHDELRQIGQQLMDQQPQGLAAALPME